MNLIEQLKSKYQGADVSKTFEQVIGDIKSSMRRGETFIVYNKYQLSEDVIAELEENGANVSEVEEGPDKQADLIMYKVSW